VQLARIMRQPHSDRALERWVLRPEDRFLLRGEGTRAIKTGERAITGSGA